MENYLISGIQQIGVGVENFREAWKWYIEMFGMDVRALEDDTVAERMLPYTGGKAQKRHNIKVLANLYAGGKEKNNYREISYIIGKDHSAHTAQEKGNQHISNIWTHKCIVNE